MAKKRIYSAVDESYSVDIFSSANKVVAMLKRFDMKYSNLDSLSPEPMPSDSELLKALRAGKSICFYDDPHSDWVLRVESSLV